MEVVELTLQSVLLIMAAVFVASIISSVTGMAGGVLMFAAMGVFVPMRPLFAIHGVVQIFNNAARSWFLRGAICWRMCGPFTGGVVIGAAATTVFIVQYLSEMIPLLLLLVLISYTLFKPKRLPQIKLADGHFFWVGIATGAMGILAGAVAPLLAAFFIRDDLSKEQVVSTKSMMQLITHLTKIPAFIYLGFSFIDHWQIIAVFTLTAVIGTRVGVWLLAKMSTALFFTAMKVALFLAGLRVSYQLIVMY